jgi:hypothetical protein
MAKIAPRRENPATLVHAVRGEKVLSDAGLASLYGVATKVLNPAVKRNRDRFPANFMFQLPAPPLRRDAATNCDRKAANAAAGN